MSKLTVNIVIDQAQQLPVSDKLLLIEKLATSIRSKLETTLIMPKSGRRIIGLFAGKGEMWMADDFDAPLPNRFWLGEEGEDSSL